MTTKKKNNLPETLKPYNFHGLDLNIQSKEATADCPFCGKESKFTIDIESSKWRCFTCKEQGNQYTFIRNLWKQSFEQPVDYTEIVEERDIREEVLKDWGLCRSTINNDWILPGNSLKDKKITQLYRYVLIDGKRRFLSTPTLPQAMYGAHLLGDKHKQVYICEGPFDAMTLYQHLATSRLHEGIYTSTGYKKRQSLISKCSVLAVPGCQIFKPVWGKLLKGRDVALLFDNDHPKKHPNTGETIEPAGLQGLKKATSLLHKYANTVSYLSWGDQGYNTDLDNGYDLSDFLQSREDLENLERTILPSPQEWCKGEEKEKKETLFPRECTSWIRLVNQWKKALKWSEGLENTLAAMLAAVVSTEIPGNDQIWIQVISPASSGKTTLCEAVSVAKEYVYAKDTLTGLLSGYRSDKGATEDHSPVDNLRNKTLAIKDADTITSGQHLEKILSQFRALYDRNIRSQYLTKEVSRDYEDINCTIILCGTNSLRRLDASELGARFLVVVIMEEINDEQENEIIDRVVAREFQIMSQTSSTTQMDKQKKLAMELTGGYVQYLRENDVRLVSAVSATPSTLNKIGRLAKFIAFMRSRPSKFQAEATERELAARLSSQLVRLARCLAAVLGRKTIDAKIFRMVRTIAFDTAKGTALDIALLLNKDPTCGELNYLRIQTGQREDVLRGLLRHLTKIKVLDYKKVKRTSKARTKAQSFSKSRNQWVLTPSLQTLIKQVLR